MIPLMKNAFLHEQETLSALVEFLRTADRLSMGEQCRIFEETFAKAQGCADAVLVNSGSSANLLLLQAMKNLGRLREGDRIGFSALTWSTNVMPIIQLGMVPVPVDIEPNTLNCSSRTFLQRLGETDMQGFFITNALGLAGDLGEIQRICRERGIHLMEDNCESLGTVLPGGGKTGSFGAASSFSFFVAHHMSTIEGGMLATDDEELARMFRIARANGWDRNLSATDQIRLRKEHGVKSELYAKYTFYDLAFNVRPTEITGFLGLKQLEYLEDNIAIRQKNYYEIEAVVAANNDMIPIERGHIQSMSPFAMPFICKTEALFEQYASAFAAAGIEIRPMIAGNMQLQPFYKKYVDRMFDLPNADFVHRCGYYCGNYPELTKADLETFKSCLLR
jgi:CDP-6-deoxy-D-xylo-4-hexulose-3-dehydrase